MAKPTLKISSDKNKNTQLTASGELNAQHANEIKATYLQVMEKGSQVHLSLEAVTAFDVAAFQLTYLLKKEVEQNGRKVTITLPQNPALKALLEKSSINKIL